MDETERRRNKQIEYNAAHGITPMTVSKSKEQVIAQTSVLDIKGYDERSALVAIGENHVSDMAAEDQASYSTIPQMEKHIAKLKKSMEKAAKDLDFMDAARLRDLMFEAKKRLEEMKK